METTPRLPESHEQPVALPAETSAYLTRLAQEHAKFLGVLADANSLLPADAAQVSKMAGIQSRLTQEFFDAQRAIIRRRAETDVLVGRIGADSSAAAGSMLAEARTKAALLHGGRPLTLPRPGAVPAPLAAPAPPQSLSHAVPGTSSVALADAGGSTTVHRRIAELGTTVVRNVNDVGELAELIDDALQPAEPDGAVIKRQLREVLDEWWRSENQEGTAAVDDANARAAMRLHLVRIEADEIVGRADPRTARVADDVYRYHPSPVLSPPMIEALEGTDHEHLDDVLASMLDALNPAAPTTSPTPPPAAPVVESAAEEPALPPAANGPSMPPGTPPVGRLEPQQTPAPLVPPSEVVIRLPDRPAAHGRSLSPALDDGFWNPASSSRHWVFPHVLLPAVAVIGVLAFVLAVVG